MQRKPVESWIKSGASEDPPSRELHPSYGAALLLSNVVFFGQDEELRYLWIENHPQGMTIAEVKGKSDDEIMPLAAACQILPAKREVLNTGQPRTIEFQWEIDGAARWYELRIQAERNHTGRVAGITCAAIDISERKQSESHLRVLLLELAHRSKNLLAVIQGICNQTAQSSTSIDEFGRRFSGRLMSLSRAHDILSDQNWRGAAMIELIRTQVLLFAGNSADRVDYAGDAVFLRPNAAQYVGLALYELTANALKYGALSGNAGRVKIRWELIPPKENAPGLFELVWEEARGPRVEAPKHRHFGRILLEEVVPLSVEGTASLAFAASGAYYQLTMPASELS
jgi:PAS domain S-box-containing protein